MSQILTHKPDRNTAVSVTLAEESFQSHKQLGLRPQNIRPVIKLIGMEWYSWHGFRRGIASNLYELGADEKIVHRVLRHAKVHVTKDRYIKAFDPAVLAAMEEDGDDLGCHETLCTNCAPN